MTRNSFDFANKSMNGKRVFMTMLFLIAGHTVFMFYNSGHDEETQEEIHEIILFDVTNSGFTQFLCQCTFSAAQNLISFEIFHLLLLLHTCAFVSDY